MPSNPARRPVAASPSFPPFSRRRDRSGRRATRGPWQGLLWLLGWWLVASPGEAQLAISLAWDAPAECPTRAWAIKRLSARLDGGAATGAQRAGAARVTIAQDAQGFSVTLQTDAGEAHGERELRGSDCAALADAATLIIALSLSAQQAEPAAPHPPAAQPAAEVDNPEPPSAATASGFSLRAGPVLDLGWLDRPTLGPELVVHYEGSALGLEVSGLWLTPRTVGAEASGRVRATLVTGRIAGCSAPWRERRGLRLWGCAGIEAGGYWGQGVDVSETQRTRGLWLSPLVGPRLSWRLTRHVGVSFQALGLAGLVQPRFVVTERTTSNVTVVHQPSRLALRTALDAQWHF